MCPSPGSLSFGFGYPDPVGPFGSTLTITFEDYLRYFREVTRFICGALHIRWVISSKPYWVSFSKAPKGLLKNQHHLRQYLVHRRIGNAFQLLAAAGGKI